MLEGCTDLIAEAAACLRAGTAPVRVAPARGGEALFVAHRARATELRIVGPGPVVALGPQDGAGVVVLHLDPDAVRRAIATLPGTAPPLAFPAGFVCDGGHRARIATLSIQSTLAAAALTAAPDLPTDWPRTLGPASLPLLRLLLAAARECAATPSTAWLARLAAALDTQWRAGQGPVMRLIDPADPAGTATRLALAGRGAALLARAAAAGLV